MPQCNGITCSIWIPGSLYTIEYDIKDSPELLQKRRLPTSRTVYKYIQLEPGCKFAFSDRIEYSRKDPWPQSKNPDAYLKTFVVHYLIDGKFVYQGIRLLYGAGQSQDLTSKWTYQNGAWHLQDFVTAKLNVSTDAPVQATSFQHLGQIEVIYYRGHCQPNSAVRPVQQSSRSVEEPVSVVSEQLLKGRDLEVSAGLSDCKAVDHVPRSYASTRADTEPYAAFVFLYRTQGKIARELTD